MANKLFKNQSNDSRMVRAFCRNRGRENFE